jgi:hypothetical protein
VLIEKFRRRAEVLLKEIELISGEYIVPLTQHRESELPKRRQSRQVAAAAEAASGGQYGYQYLAA